MKPELLDLLTGDASTPPPPITERDIDRVVDEALGSAPPDESAPPAAEKSLAESRAAAQSAAPGRPVSTDPDGHSSSPPLAAIIPATASVPANLSIKELKEAMRKTFVNRGKSFLNDASGSTNDFLTKLFDTLSTNLNTKECFEGLSRETIRFFFSELKSICEERDAAEQTCIDLGICNLHDRFLSIHLDALQARLDVLKNRLPSPASSARARSKTKLPVPFKRVLEVQTDMDMLTTLQIAAPSSSRTTHAAPPQTMSTTARFFTVKPDVRLAAKKACLETILLNEDPNQFSALPILTLQTILQSSAVNDTTAEPAPETPSFLKKGIQTQLSSIAYKGALTFVNDRYKKHTQDPKHIRCIKKDKNPLWILQLILSALTVGLCAIGFAIHSRWRREPGARTGKFWENSTQSCENRIAKELEKSLQNTHVHEIRPLALSLERGLC